MQLNMEVIRMAEEYLSIWKQDSFNKSELPQEQKLPVGNCKLTLVQLF